MQAAMMRGIKYLKSVMLLFQVKDLTSVVVVRRVGYVYPAVVFLVDELVEIELERFSEIEELFVKLFATGCDIGSLSPEVLRIFCSFNESVNLLGSESGVDSDRHTPCLSERVENIIDQTVKIFDFGDSWSVSDTVSVSSGRVAQLRNGEVFHDYFSRALNL